jgi:iron complex outermembrane receptor protein
LRRLGSKGIEFDLNSQITDRWFINANYSYTDAQIEKDQDLARLCPLRSPT